MIHSRILGRYSVPYSRHSRGGSGFLVMLVYVGRLVSGTRHSLPGHVEATPCGEIPAFIADSEADCMCPCALFAFLSPSPPCRQLPYLQILSSLHPNNIGVPVTLLFQSL